MCILLRGRILTRRVRILSWLHVSTRVVFCLNLLGRLILVSRRIRSALVIVGRILYVSSGSRSCVLCCGDDNCFGSAIQEHDFQNSGRKAGFPGPIMVVDHIVKALEHAEDGICHDEPNSDADSGRFVLETISNYATAREMRAVPGLFQRVLI